MAPDPTDPAATVGKSSRTRFQGAPGMLILQQQANLAALASQSARGFALLNRPGTDLPTSTQVQRKIAALEKLWQACDHTHRELLACTAAPDLDEYLEEDTYSAARDRHYDLVEQLEGILESTAAAAAATAAAAAAAAVAAAAAAPPVDPLAEPVHQPQVRPVISTLERIPVPTFDGVLKDWPNFRDMFTVLVIEDATISNVFKLSYLKRSLKGNALSIIKNIEISGDNFTRAWQLVTDHYQNVNSLTFSHIVRLLKLEPVDSRKPGQLERLFLETREILASLESLNEPVKDWSSLLVVLTLLRLDSGLRQDWEHSIGRRATFPKFEELEEFLQTRIHSDSLSTFTSGVITHSQSASPVKNKVSDSRLKYNAHLTTSSRSICTFCQSTSHDNQSCHVLLKLNPSDRLQKVTSHNLCVKCLRKGHRPWDCHSNVNCAQCDRRHHSLLHDSYNQNRLSDMSVRSSGVSPPANVSVSSHIATHSSSTSLPKQLGRSGNVLLATALVRVSSLEGRVMTLRALIDQGSERSFISEAAAQRLRLTRCNINATIVGIGGNLSGHVKHVSTVLVNSVNLNSTAIDVNVDCLIVPKVTSYVPRRYATPGMWQHVCQLPLADPELHGDRAIDMLLCADVYGTIIRDGIIRYPDEPLAQLTMFGWILSGPCVNVNSPQSPSNKSPSVICSLHVSTNEDLSDSLCKFWEIEETPTTKFLTPDEQRCEDIFVRTTKRDSSGRYTVNLPFTNDPPLDIGDSYGIAYKQYERLERRLTRDPMLCENYHDFLNEYLKLGHMSPYIPRSDQCQTYYIPHHPVIKESSTTTKVRVVFNASCQTTNGKSLNDSLLIGPKLQQDLSSIILRWRLHQYGMVADAEKMFRQIRVAAEHAPFQLILWRPRETEPIQTFQLDTVTYGTASAPYLSLKVLHQLATDERANFPSAANELLENTYVDDIVFGSSSIEEARSLRNDILSLTGRGCFSFRKWISNEHSLLSDLTPDLCDSSLNKEFVIDSSRKVLGISWGTNDDQFHYSLVPALPLTLTKRLILSFIAKLYDPLGWLAPVVIVAKIFMQQLWLCQITWDESIPSELVSSWLKFSNELHHLQVIKVPRWVGSSPDSDIQLHVFCDASQHAYAAAIYIRINRGHEIITRLLVSKTKVAPLKSLTIPRLELCAAELGSRLLVWTVASLPQSDIPCFAWSDSAVTLAWISASPSRWKIFIANRVSRIQTRCPHVSWCYVSTEQNPADLASRGCSASTISDHRQWWHGPEWLSQPREVWPSSHPDVDNEIDLEERPLAVHIAHVDLCNYASRCSDWGRLVRTAATLLRYIAILHSRIRGKSLDSLQNPSSDLLFSFRERARLYWIKTAQAYCFPVELPIVRSRGVLPRRNRLISLSPYLDQDDVLRVGGRLDQSALLDDGKHPILLSKCHIAHLIIKHAHARTLHGGISLTSRLLAETYWIFRAKSLIKSEIQRCTSCVRFRAACLSQRMAPLPSFRVNRRRAFQHVGVDYAGPILVKFGSGRGQKSHKAYISVFVCLNTRAIHLELVHAYSTDAFLAAFRRFIARRGLPSLVMSDNGTNFKGADRELERDFKLAMSDTRIASTLAEDRVEWRFIPPGSPHFGGMWESGVKSVKHHLKRVSGDHRLDVEEFSTLLCRIEACLNSRPIAGFSNNPDDLSYLTPGHFLIGCALIAPPEPSVLHLRESHLSRWQATQSMLERFWKIWSSDYLRSLQTRNKWRTAQPDVPMNAIVIIKDENLPPAKWALGRVLQTHPGKDGLTRVCQVRTATSVLTRPIHKLCLLPNSEDSPSSEDL